MPVAQGREDGGLKEENGIWARVGQGMSEPLGGTGLDLNLHGKKRQERR